MSNQTLIKAYVEDALRTNKLAVLATEGGGQPHACFIAITPMDDFAHLIFATYRNTRKYNNLVNNGKVAILFENRSTKSLSQPDITVVTAFGIAEELDITVADTALQAHLSTHPELKAFLLSADCTLFNVKVNGYQLVNAIDDVSWWILNEVESK